MADVACPVCSEVGRTGALVLRQINAEEGIYVCNNSQCPYPVGISDNTIQISVPELREISNEPTKNGICVEIVSFSVFNVYSL